MWRCNGGTYAEPNIPTSCASYLSLLSSPLLLFSRSPHGNSGQYLCPQTFHTGYACPSSCARPILVVATWFPDMLNAPTLAPWDQQRELVHRWPYLPYVFICLFMPKRFCYICSALFIVESGWAEWMSAWRDAERSGRSLEEVWTNPGFRFDRVPLRWLAN